MIIILKRIVLTIMVFFVFANAQAETKKFNMVFVPASEKGDESDYKSLISIVEKLTGFEINTIKVTDYNAAVEAMRAGRADIAWYGGMTYIKAAEIADAEAFAAGVRPGEKIHEEMISSSDSSNTLELSNYFVIIPKEFEKIRKLYIKNRKAKKVVEGFSYTSDNNSHFLSSKELKELIKLHE